MRYHQAVWSALAALAILIGSGSVATAQQPPPAGQEATATTAAAPDREAAIRHLHEAKATLDGVPATAFSGSMRRTFTELKRHFTALERSYMAGGAATVSQTQRPSGGTRVKIQKTGNWSAHAVEVDRLTGKLLAAPVGTSGTSMALDESVKTTLQEFRTHLTAFAAAATGTVGATGSPAAAPTTGSAPEPAPVGTTGVSGAAPSPSAAAPSPSAPAAGADSTKHLADARRTLTELTQLPAAAQITGDVRTQVSVIIAGFNAIITDLPKWQTRQAEIDQNLMALLGPVVSTPMMTPETPVGTAGVTVSTLDPTIKAKLEEFRTHWDSFVAAAASAQPKPPQL